MDAAGPAPVIDQGQWPEQLKKARAGQLMIWQLGYSAANPDVQDGLGILMARPRAAELSRASAMPRFDEMFRRMKVLPDGPEWLALLQEAMQDQPGVDADEIQACTASSPT